MFNLNYQRTERQWNQEQCNASGSQVHKSERAAKLEEKRLDEREHH